jgi:hypothetical protein
MNYNSTIVVCASKATTYNPGGFDLERIEDGIMHTELRDSLTCGICLGKDPILKIINAFRNSLRPNGVRELSKAFLQQVYIALEEELSLSVSGYPPLETELPGSSEIPTDNQSKVSQLRRACVILSD